MRAVQVSPHILREFRLALTEGAETGMLITADRLDESDNPADHELAELLRTYVNIQTYIRTSSPIPTDMGDRYTELQSKWTQEPRKYLRGGWYGNCYSNPLGPLYLNITVSMPDLANNLNWLSEEPARNIEIDNCTAGKDLGMILRNYRVDAAYSLSLRFRTRTRNMQEVASALQNATIGSANRVIIRGLDDRLKIVQMGFLMAPGIRKGCELLMAERYSDPRRVKVK